MSVHNPPFGVNRGAAYVYWRDGDVWSLQSKLAGSDGSAGDLLGTTVEIAGPFVFAGAPMNDGPNGADSGTIYIYSGQVHRVHLHRWLRVGEYRCLVDGRRHDE